MQGTDGMALGKISPTTGKVWVTILAYMHLLYRSAPPPTPPVLMANSISDITDTNSVNNFNYNISVVLM